MLPIKFLSLQKRLPIVDAAVIIYFGPGLGKRTPDFSAIRKAAAQRNRTQNTAQAAPEFEWSAYRPGMELSDYDRQRRMKQLDDWLKTGLIDKEEYRVLKRIYMEEL